MVHNFMLWDLISPACASAADRVAADIGRAMRSLGDDSETHSVAPSKSLATFR